MNNRLPILAADIRAAHTAIAKSAAEMAERAIAAGHMLIEAKTALPHGGWDSWLRDHVGLSARTARRYMQLARSGLETATVADLGIRGAAERLARTPGFLLPQPGQFARSKADGEDEAFVWPAEGGRFHVYVLGGIGAPHGTTTRRPVAAAGVEATLIRSGYPLEQAWTIEALQDGGAFLEGLRANVLRGDSDPAYLAWRDELMKGLNKAPSPAARDQVIQAMRDQVEVERFAAMLRERMDPADLDKVCGWLSKAEPHQVVKLLTAKVRESAT